MNWLGEQELRGLQILVPPTGAGAQSHPHRADLAWRQPGVGSTCPTMASSPSRPSRTDRITVTLLDGGNAASVPSTGVVTALPVGVAELTLIGVP